MENRRGKCQRVVDAEGRTKEGGSLDRGACDDPKDSRQEEKGMTEDELFGWHHRLNGHESEQALGVGDGQESLVCCSPWDCKELDPSSSPPSPTCILFPTTWTAWLSTQDPSAKLCAHFLPHPPPFPPRLHALSHLQQSQQDPSESSGTPPRHAHGDLTSLAPHERLPDTILQMWKLRQ